jgi:hypothetical protein
MRRQFSIGAGPILASSIGHRRNPSPCGWIPTLSNGSKPTAAVIRPKRIGFYGTPCFTLGQEKVLPAAGDTPDGLARQDGGKEKLDSFRRIWTLPLDRSYRSDSPICD